MNIKKLIETQEILWQNMRDNGYCREYLMSYYRELRWIEANAEKYNVSSYEELCKIRLQSTKPYKVSHTKSMFGTFKLFEEDGEFPDRKRHQPLVKKATYYRLWFCWVFLSWLSRISKAIFHRKEQRRYSADFTV